MAVYFIEQSETGLVKIGVSDNPEKRLRQLQTSSPHSLSIIRCVDSWSFPEERWLHSHYFHARQSGEWFDWEDSMLTIDVPEDLRNEIDHRREIKADILHDMNGASLESIKAAAHILKISALAERLKKEDEKRQQAEERKKLEADADAHAINLLKNTTMALVSDVLVNSELTMTAREIGQKCFAVRKMEQKSKIEMLDKMEDLGIIISAKDGRFTRYGSATS